MIITDRFVFIHLHKTGGQTLNNVIERCIPEHQVVGYHYPRAAIPPESAALPVVGMVRNPWDWYVSWYAFNKRPNIHNRLFEVVSDGGHATFKAILTNLILLGSERPESRFHRDDLIRMLPESLEGNRSVGLVKDDIRGLDGSGGGYYSWLVQRMLGDPQDGRTHIGRFEHLQQDFVSTMRDLDVEQAETMDAELDRRERRNVSHHSHYSHYYDDELRDLVAREEAPVIEGFGYSFDRVKPPGAVYDFPRDMYPEGGRGFAKLLGRGENFLKLHADFDVGTIREKIDQIPAARWLESERERMFDVHRDTQALLLVHYEDFKYERPDYRELYAEWQDELAPLVDYVSRYYQDNGFVIRLLLAKLLAGGEIPQHTDAGYSLLNCHRVHLPIVTNDEVAFIVGGEEINMQVGELWEINNGTVHAVENRGDEDRIHLIIDWMPNYAGKPEEQVLAADQPEGADVAAGTAATINAMLARAHQLHQTGQAEKAESLYRQILHFDENHVAANNLLGLLCLQTKRADEAAELIRKALLVMPDDAQAHSNLGLALKDLGQHEGAEKQFHESLKRDPNNPRVYNNLGGIYMTVSRIEDAITCFKQALAIQPGFAEVHFNLGNALLHLRRFPEAVTSLEQCLALRPDFAPGRTKLEQAQRAMKDQGGASPP